MLIGMNLQIINRNPKNKNVAFPVKKSHAAAAAAAKSVAAGALIWTKSYYVELALLRWT